MGAKGILEILALISEDQMTYDSTADTLAHIHRVQYHLGKVTDLLTVRGDEHDQSKLGPVEKPLIDALAPQLEAVEYGSDDYKAVQEKYADFYRIHYAQGRHHPQRFEDGIAGMNLVDIMEMFCDWKAASERNGNEFARSVEIGIERFKVEPQFAAILRNSVEVLSEAALKGERGT